ncbi:hypothetical protein ONZ45_g15277 [Pleurotus djamor]|nr:hypothetical protein ONZ45_g15277 [Pleurotus djamor]
MADSDIPTPAEDTEIGTANTGNSIPTGSSSSTAVPQNTEPSIPSSTTTPPSAMTTVPRKKKRSAAKAPSKPKDEPPKKRGNKGDFTGYRLQVLEEELSNYCKATATNANTVHTWFTLQFFPRYWDKFHWSVPLNKDTSDIVGPLLPKEDELLCPEQRKVKKGMVDAAMKKIKSWFNYRRNALGLNNGKDPWNPLLEKIRMLSDAPPRKLSEGQFYMLHPDFKAKVDAIFNVKWPASELPESHRMAFQCGVSQELLDAEGDKVKARIRKELDASHALDLQDYHKGIWVEDADPEDRARAISSMAPLLQPLLDGIRAVTGLYCGFFAAAPPPNGKVEDINCICLTSGQSVENGQELSQVDPKGFSQATRLFVRSVAIASGYRDPRTRGTGVLEPETPHITRIITNPLDHQSSTPSTPIEGRIPPLVTSTSTSAAHPSSDSQSGTTHPAEPLDPIAIIRSQLKDIQFPIGDALINAVAKLPPAKKKARIRELKAMDKVEFERANNITNNAVLLTSLGIKDASSIFRPPPRPSSIEPSGDEADFAPSSSLKRTAKQMQAPQDARLTRSKATTSTMTTTNSVPSTITENANDLMDGDGLGDSAEQDHGFEDNSNETNDDEEADPDVQGPADFEEDEEAEGVDDDTSTVQPQWFTRSFETFSSVDEGDYGPTWMRLLDHWASLDADASFEPNGLLLTAKSRPYEILYWIKSKHPLSRPADIKDPVAFGEKWWAWWININPSWRRTKNGKSLKRSRSGLWEEDLPVTGLNGILSVIAGLWFWREAINTSAALASWQSAVASNGSYFCQRGNTCCNTAWWTISSKLL